MQNMGEIIVDTFVELIVAVLLMIPGFFIAYCVGANVWQAIITGSVFGILVVLVGILSNLRNR